LAFAASAASFAAAGLGTGVLFSGAVAGGGGAFALVLATLSSRLALALDASLDFVEPDEEPWSFADFWPCDFVVVAAVDLLLSPTALATAASLVVEPELVLTGSLVLAGGVLAAVGVGAGVGAGVTGSGAGAGCEEPG
jgi:hypothetical protein